MKALDDRGYAMAALLVGMSVMAVLMSVALPVWSTASQREKEAELVFRGNQYARAVQLFQRRFPGQFPPTLDVLLNGKFLRKRYMDPMTRDGEFQLVYAGQQQPDARGRLTGPGVQGGIMGVVSKSTAPSLRLINGRQANYNELPFVAVQATTQGGTGGRGTQTPGQPTAPGGGGRLQQPGRGGQTPQPGRGRF